MFPSIRVLAISLTFQLTQTYICMYPQFIKKCVVLQITSDLFNTVDDFCSISYRLCFSFFLNIVTQNSLNGCHLQVYNELCVLNTVSNQFISGFTNHFLFSLFLSITATSYGLIPKCHLTI